MAPLSPEFSLIIPTFNESGNILVLLDDVGAVLAKENYEVIVVDDDSPDRTWEIAETYGKTHPQVRVVRRTVRKGLSAAILNGFDEAKAPYMAVMDADLSHDTKVLKSMLEELRKGANMVVASRRVPGGGADHWPWFRRLYSNTATMLARIWLNVSIHDPMSGYFGMNRRVYERVRPKMNPRGYKTLLEIATRAQVGAVPEIPFIFRDRRQGVSKLTGGVAMQYLHMLWDLKAYSQIGRIFSTEQTKH